MKNFLIVILLFTCSLSYGQVSTLQILPANSVVASGTNGTLDLGIYALNSSLQTTNNNVAKNTNDIAALQAGSTGTVVKTINTSNYVITQADNGAILCFTTSCTIATSSLQAGFKCQCQQRGGTIQFAGTYNSRFNYKRCQTQWGWVEVIATGNNIVALKGDLKQ